ncbi:magnesium chelatase [Marmoricola endophyticus]|uniref:Mg-protoporphyrin IX chelatase n=1 Tax=Marmoricola endophyticus TaxID=2040280 RepID=A0A917BAD5_9ACTN|nr:VWA domain-containing protein [Marmoricola endophyticus]GGF31955.1 magnesium chelatase [Marmoricola endophyticus]
MPQYPFSAVVGADPTDPDGLGDMALALVLTTISPEVGGVLVRGEKGTAKSTIVRALAAVLPPIEVVDGDRFSSRPGESSPDGTWAVDAPTSVRPVRLVELPVGATEDRVLGSLHLERALSQGKAEYEPGLLARAHRGLLYVDEVNLLHDHLVDLLLDAAAMGRSTVERDGVSVEHAARFVLVGTMNPEEGELRPQLLDRFGLTVEVAAPRDPEVRVDVVRRRMAYDADPDGFAAAYADAEQALRERVADAQARVGTVELGDRALSDIARVCAAFEVDGMRADIVTARAAIAHAAWHGRTRVTRADVRAAALLALPHRRRRNPFDAPGLDEDLLDQVLGDDEPEPPEPEPESVDETEASPDEGDDPTETAPEPPDSSRDPGGTDDSGTRDTGESSRPGQDDAASPPQSEGRDASPGDDAEDATPQAVAGMGQAYRTRLFTVRGTGAGEAGRRSRAVTETGRRTGAEPGAHGSIHLAETIRAAAPHQAERGRGTGPGAGPLRFAPADLRVATREGQESNLVLFCVDASGSMAAKRRMEQVKTAILSLLLDAYQRRDKVGLITFRGSTAELVLPPTRSVDVAATRLGDLATGGRTPLDEGLLEARRVLAVERVREPRRRPLLVLVTDGRATNDKGAVARSRRAAELLAGDDVASLVIDCETGPMRMGLAHALSAALRGEHVPVAEVSAAALTDAVQERVA